MTARVAHEAELPVLARRSDDMRATGTVAHHCFLGGAGAGGGMPVVAPKPALVRRFSGSTVVDPLDCERGKADSARGGGGGGAVVIAAVLLFPVICAALPIAGLTTIVTGLLVTNGGPQLGIETGGGTLILVTLVAVLVAFLVGFFAERRLSLRQGHRIVR
jgi:hypothetical protein